MPVFTEEVRKRNMEKVVKALEETDLDFNSLSFAFADIIQSTFLNALMTNKSAEERKAVHEEIVDLNNSLIDALNDNSKNLMYDMKVLTNLIMDAIENASEAAVEAATTKQ